MDRLTQDVDEALHFDALSEIEKVTGKSYKEDESLVWASMALMHEQAKTKDALLHLTDDTNSWSQNLQEWMACVERIGFKLVLCDDIPGTEDKFRIWWHEDGILLAADSYWGEKSVNGAKCWYNAMGSRSGLDGDSGFACEKDGEDVWEGGKDAREGLRHHMKKVQENAVFLKKWVKQPFLWLLHYKDTKAKDYDYKAISAERISRLPKHIQEAIAGE
jgi:hypothetical protein